MKYEVKMLFAWGILFATCAAVICNCLLKKETKCRGKTLDRATEKT